MMHKVFCKAKDKQIFDQFNKPLYIKGVGIGGWLLLEGYMIQSYQDLDRPRRIKEHISKMVDPKYAEYFFTQWQKIFFTKKDLDFLKEEGFNCIRIPIDYQVLFLADEKKIALEEKENAFQLLDDIIDYCHQINMYVILDLHACPGGQTGTNIDNSENNQPQLFQKRLYQQQTMHIWKTLAKRYKDEEYILAYDLLNEPLPNWFGQYNSKLYPLYEEIIQVIRQVDPYHMITLEGLHWSTDLSIFSRLPDDNILLQFHKYWSNPDIESIQPYLDLREKHGVPLLMGEGGENNLAWYSSVFKMYQQLSISFVFWTYKKMELENSLVTFKRPSQWADFLNGSLPKEESKTVLNSLLEHIAFEQCQYHAIVTNHLLQKDAFKTPGFAFDYTRGSTKKSIHHPSSFRSSDGLKIANLQGEIIEPNFKQYNGEMVPRKDRLSLFLSKGEYVQYSFYLSTLSEIDICVSGEAIEHLNLQVDESFSHNGFLIKSITLSKGRHVLYVKASRNLRIDCIEMKNVRPL